MEREGFEPPITTLADRCFRPLSHLPKLRPACPGSFSFINGSLRKNFGFSQQLYRYRGSHRGVDAPVSPGPCRLEFQLSSRPSAFQCFSVSNDVCKCALHLPEIPNAANKKNSHDNNARDQSGKKHDRAPGSDRPAKPVDHSHHRIQ